MSFTLTAFIEAAQRSIPGRVPDAQDLLANGAGAVIGCFLALVLTLPAELHRRRTRRRRGQAATAPAVPTRAR